MRFAILLTSVLAAAPDKATFTLVYWDLASGKQLQEWKGLKEPIVALAFSEDGSKALTASTNEPLQLWNLSTGKPLNTLEGHPKGTTCVALSPGGTQAVTGGNDGAVRLCDLQSGKVLQ